MNDKLWYIVYTKNSNGGLLRYAIEHKYIQEFEDEKHFKNWQTELEQYFRERTAIEEEVIAIEPAEFLSAYSYDYDKEV